MAEFCTCGSIMIGGQCSNKNCALRSSKSDLPKASRTRKAASGEPKRTAKRASKCITYNLYEVEEEESV